MRDEAAAALGSLKNFALSAGAASGGLPVMLVAAKRQIPGSGAEPQACVGRSAGLGQPWAKRQKVCAGSAKRRILSVAILAVLAWAPAAGGGTAAADLLAGRFAWTISEPILGPADRPKDPCFEVDPADLRMLFQGVTDRARAGKPYGQIPWRLGMLEPAAGRP